MKILIKNGQVLDPVTAVVKKQDILIENEIIIKRADSINDEEAQVIDASGKTVTAGLIDMHCHLRDPGFEYKEDIITGTRSAARGGFTSVACMPNTAPVLDCEPLIKYVIDKAKKEGFADVYPIGAISRGMQGELLSDMGELKHAGAVAVSDDGKPVSNAGLMRRALEYARMFDLAVISHCEDLSLLDGGVINEGFTSTCMGLKGISNAVEEVQVARDIILAEITKSRLHLAHVSTKGSVELVRQAKKRGVKVTCETCPHYFSLTEKACEGFDTNAKMNPPLRTSEDVKAVIEGLADGTIDVIATDHAPHHTDEKNVEFSVAANGIVGFETALPLAVTYLVKSGKMSLAEVIRKLTVNPAEILNIDKGTLDTGKRADIVIFDENEKFTVDTEKFISRSKNSPYGGFELYGKVYTTILGGKVIG